MSKQPTRPYFAVRDLHGGQAITSSYKSIERTEEVIRKGFAAGRLVNVKDQFGRYTKYIKDTGRYYIVNVKRDLFKTIDLPGGIYGTDNE